MISYKCRSCGGDMKVISKGMGECLYCTGIDSMPTIDSEKFNRAEKLRREQQYFDEAADLYKQIIAENPDEEEAYWGLVLCKFGIEYVKDINEELKPTCHRTIETSILDDVDYKIACEKADEEKRKHYQKQAKKIQTIQSNILDIVRNQKPYDIFISFKSKDEYGNSTVDCNEARKIYYKLKDQNYTVFFSEETLESGKEYEPQIYAALKTAKIMILIGSREEYVEATWVKNEWKRFKRMIDNGEKKTIIPICIDMDPYKLPMDLKMYQAINWRDSEAMLKLTESVGDLAEKKSDIQAANLDDVYRKYEHERISKKIDNVRMYIENNQFGECKTLLKEIIRDDPSNSDAYWLRLLLMAKSEHKVKNILDMPRPIKNENDYVLAVKYATEEKKREYEKISNAINRKYEYANNAMALHVRCRELSDADGNQIKEEMGNLQNIRNSVYNMKKKGWFKEKHIAVKILLIWLMIVGLMAMLNYIFIAIPVVGIIIAYFVLKSKKRKKLIAQYYERYSVLNEQLDMKMKNSYDEANAMYERYCKMEPVEYELKKDLRIYQLENSYKAIREEYAPHFN